MDFDIPADIAALLGELDEFIERVVQPHPGQRRQRSVLRSSA